MEANGHEPEKIELIVIGGTWSVLPKAYKYWYIKECFRAANDYGRKIPNPLPRRFFGETGKSQILDKTQNLKQQLSFEQKRNENARYRIIGVTLETRPDYINDYELLEMRELGCTRVEMGVQAIDDKILSLNKRG